MSWKRSGTGSFSPWYWQKDCGDDGTEGRRREMGVGLGGGGAGGGRAMANEGVSEEETRKHCRVTHVSAYL